MIRIKNLQMTYRSEQGVVQAVRDLSLEVKQGEFYTLLGPSGCGKTTTLRCVAGLEKPDTGEIVVSNKVVYSSADGTLVAPHHRNIGMVFQSYAIWPHMDVFDNVALPLLYVRPKLSRAKIREKVMEELSLVQLEGLEHRPAPFLSGGQQQRLAMARALVAEPQVLLLDEPLSNLDAKLREEMRCELRDLVKRLDLTTLYVTHEQVEALTMSDVIAVMNDGRIVQEGSPHDVYSAPRESFVAEFIGKTNFLPGRIVSQGLQDGKGLAKVETSVGVLRCRMAAAMREGDSAVVAVRPEDVTIYQDQPSPEIDVVEGEVEIVAFLGDAIECTVKVADQRILVKLNPRAAMSPGKKVFLNIPWDRCLPLGQ